MAAGRTLELSFFQKKELCLSFETKRAVGNDHI